MTSLNQVTFRDDPTFSRLMATCAGTLGGDDWQMGTKSAGKIAGLGRKLECAWSRLVFHSEVSQYDVANQLDCETLRFKALAQTAVVFDALWIITSCFACLYNSITAVLNNSYTLMFSSLCNTLIWTIMIIYIFLISLHMWLSLSVVNCTYLSVMMPHLQYW